MPDKVELPKSVAEAIETAWKFVQTHKNGYEPLKYISLTNWSYMRQTDHLDNELEILQEYAINHPVEYMNALVNGYEVEQTPEEKAHEFIRKIFADPAYGHGGNMNESRSLGIREGIKLTLDILNIDIEGVND